ncbi:2-keto-4-pentenoate hydratase [Sutcliffiella halmapala]|uniref:2-keto-4-pentenoate hydratase n=1 Tax=Sutcliffiella halmapala TaxID=79882 RepID=UPI000994CEF0|nr:fumarylacetoacetate hydrolase family protein [Sutcliffiella halmapala]
MDLLQIAKQVAQHQQKGQEMDKITLSHPKMNTDHAYEIQKLSMEQAIENGDRLIGWKMGLTSKAKQLSVGVEEAIYGRLTSSMELTESTLHVGPLIHPRVEPEFAFVLNRELKGEHITVRDVWMATECIFPAIEVIDSRYRNFSFTLEDVIADNASSSKFILGNQAFSPYFTSWDTVEVKMRRNGEVVQSGVGAAVLDHPVKSIVELVKMLNKEGLSVQPGMVVLAGGITEAINVYAGDVIEVHYDKLGTLKLHIEQ